MPIVVRYSESAGTWVACFEGVPQVAFGAEHSTTAAKRLLWGSGTAPGDVELRADGDLQATGILICPPKWRPPELLFTCESCRGTAEYVGLIDGEKCEACKGKGFTSSEALRVECPACLAAP